MAKNMKTPAMILQELTVKEGLAPPEYNLIQSKTGTHENEFHYQVIVGGVSALGFGRSKQVAKHATAQKALKLLAEKGVFSMDDESVQEFNPKLHRNETDSRSIPPVNFVGSLGDLCAEHKIAQPAFVEISDVGPPHARQFTWKCKISSITTQATANTKKQAKQLCAQEMLERLKDVLPEVVQEEELRKRAILDNDAVINKYMELTSAFPGVIPNKAINIGEYNTVIKTLMNDNNLKLDDFKEEFSQETEEALKQLLSRLGLTYRFDEIEGQLCIVVLSISVDVPLSCIGTGGNQEDAKLNAVEEAFKLLRYYTNID